MRSNRRACVCLVGVLLLAALGIPQGAGVDVLAGAAAAAAAPAKAGMVTDLTGLSGHGFNDIAWEGFKKAQSSLGVDVTLVESREQADYEVNLKKLASERHNVVVGVGFLLTDAIVKAASEFPGTKFALIDSVPDTIPGNLRCYVFREEEGSFLVGFLAGKMTKTGKVGFVGGMDSPLIRKFEAGFRAGVMTANPKVKVSAAYVGSFTDPAKGKQIADMMYNSGADIVYQAAGESGLGVIDAVKARTDGSYAVGVDMDQDSLAPGKVLTSMVKRVDTACFAAIEDTVRGRFTSGVVSLGIKEGGIGLSEMRYTKSKVPAQVMAELEKYSNALRDGKFKVPTSLDELAKFKAPAF